MKTFAQRLGAWTILVAAGGWSAGSAADIYLFDFGINIDDVTTCASGPCDTEGVLDLAGVLGVDDTGFDYLTGTGAVSVSVTGAGDHYVVLFVDHEMSETVNTFFNETGSVSGTAAAGQSYEIDEPGYVFGDIFDNFVASLLDNTNALDGFPEDVSMALGWNFTLGLEEIASIEFVLSTIMPDSGFFLSHADPDSSEAVYFSSSLGISSVSVPEPGTAFLLGAGLLALGFACRRRLPAPAQV